MQHTISLLTDLKCDVSLISASGNGQSKSIRLIFKNGLWHFEVVDHGKTILVTDVRIDAIDAYNNVQ